MIPSETRGGPLGYEDVAADFMEVRSETGAATVREWLGHLPAGASVLDLGCGHGVPVAREIVAAGMSLWAVDASPSLMEAFRARFPKARVVCAPVEEFDFFGRTFDGALAWGLMFLLPVAAQEDLIRRVATALEPGGRFLFTSPRQACEWKDTLTGRTSRSPGAARYTKLLRDAGFRLIAEMDDEGGNHYFDAVKVVAAK